MKPVVLVVDDELISQRILVDQLTKEGYEVLAANNGKESLEIVAQTPVDLVLLDIVMPEMTGYDVLEEFKRNPQLLNIPVIVISALDDIISVIKSIELGADDYLTKPFNSVLLRARVSTTLEKKRLRDLEQEYLETAKIKAEEDLRETELRLEAVVSNAPIILFSLDTAGVFVLAEGKGMEGLETGPENILGRKIEDVVGTPDQVMDDLARVMNGEGFTTTYEVADEVWEVHCNPMVNQQEEVVGVIGVALDITERKRAEEERERLFQEISSSRRRLQALSERLVEVQEQERRYIAQELHDEIGQSMTGLKITLEMATRALKAEDNLFIQEATELADELLTTVRDMSLDLRPAMLDDLGLLPAFVWHFERYETQMNVKVNFSSIGLKRRFDPKVETAVYRIVQEALTNVARYAGVDQVNVEVQVQDDYIIAKVQDHGQGFDLHAVLNKTDSNGVAGMIERASLLGGVATIKTSPGNGTVVQAEIPLSAQIERRSNWR